MWKSPLIPLSLLLLTVGSVPAQVKMEYVAHACFVIESPQGVRILIDPYNTNRWLGYHFPDQIRADAVLVSHPHYDHDANYHVSLQIPAFRQPGRFSIGDVKVQGLIGRHADQYGEDFKNINIIWVLQVDGKTFAHLGDNGPLSDRLVQDLKRADVLMVPIDSNFHILKEAEIDSIVASVKPRFLVPMHYKIPELNATMKALGPIDPWLEGRSNVVRLDENHYQFGASPDESMQILVFRPSPAVEPWSVELRQAWGAGWKGLNFLTSGEPIQATNKFNEATQMAPQVIGFWSGLATALEAQQQPVRALQALQRGLSISQPDDWEHTLGARVRLARLYARMGKTGEARHQARIVLQNSYRPALIEQAQQIFVATQEPGR